MLGTSKTPFQIQTKWVGTMRTELHQGAPWRWRGTVLSWSEKEVCYANDGGKTHVSLLSSGGSGWGVTRLINAVQYGRASPFFSLKAVVKDLNLT